MLEIISVSDFFNHFLSSSAHKTAPAVEEYKKVQDLHDVVQVKITTLYDLYKRYANLHNVTPVPIKAFYQLARIYMYYDKYVCDHGTEFYYYVVFNQDNHIYRAMAAAVSKRIAVEHPDTIGDLQYAIKAFN